MLNIDESPLTTSYDNVMLSPHFVEVVPRLAKNNDELKPYYASRDIATPSGTSDSNVFLGMTENKNPIGIQNLI